MEEIRYISKLADLTEILLDATNRYDEYDSDEFSYIINGNYVNAEWLARLVFHYKLILEKIETEKSVFDKLPAKDGTPAKYPDFFESEVMVTAINKKYTALRTAWKKAYEQFHQLLETKIDVIATISKRVEHGGYSSVFYKSITEGLDEGHNNLADSIDKLLAKYGDYAETLQAFIVFLSGSEAESEPEPVIANDSEAIHEEKGLEAGVESEIQEVFQELEEVVEALESEFEAPVEEIAEPVPQLPGSKTLVFTAIFSFIIAVGGAIRLPTTFTWVERASGYDAAVNAVIIGGACALVLIVIGILAVLFRNKAKMAILLLCIGIAYAAWGGLSLIFGFTEGAYMYFFDILSIIVAVMIIVGAVMNIKKVQPDGVIAYGFVEGIEPVAYEPPAAYEPFVYGQDTYESPIAYESPVTYENGEPPNEYRQ